MNTNALANSRKAAKYSDSGSTYDRAYKANKDKANLAVLLMCIVTAVCTFFDYHIYKPVAEKINYMLSDLSITVTCLFLAITPIAGAWLLAHLLSKIIFKAKRRMWHVIVFVLVFAGTAALLAATCALRLSASGAGASDDKATYAWAINILAILIAVVAFAIHLFLAIQRDKHLDFAEKARLQRDYSENSGEARRFEQTSHIDETRKESDYSNYCNSYVDLADAALDKMDASRNANASRYASSPEQMSAIMAHPYTIGGKEYPSRAEAKAALLKLFEAPENDAAHLPYGPAQNRLLDNEAKNTNADLDARYRKIIGSLSSAV
jgi:hypothetical protein